MSGERSMLCRNSELEKVTGSRCSFWRTTMRNRRSRTNRLVADPMSRWWQRTSLVSLLAVGLAWALPASQVAHGSEFHFVVNDLPDNAAAWLPSEVIIHTETELEGGLVFLLVNPTARTHVFFAEGIFEEIVGKSGEPTAKPLRATVAPEETVRTVLSTTQFEGSRARGEVEEFRFFCPLHRGDADPGGTIRIVHVGGIIRMVQ